MAITVFFLFPLFYHDYKPDGCFKALATIIIVILFYWLSPQSTYINSDFHRDPIASPTRQLV